MLPSNSNDGWLSGCHPSSGKKKQASSGFDSVSRVLSSIRRSMAFKVRHAERYSSSERSDVSSENTKPSKPKTYSSFVSGDTYNATENPLTSRKNLQEQGFGMYNFRDAVSLQILA